jgi:hypothetical protein
MIITAYRRGAGARAIRARLSHLLSGVAAVSKNVSDREQNGVGL